MRELRRSGSVREVNRNGHPYRDPRWRRRGSTKSPCFWSVFAGVPSPTRRRVCRYCRRRPLREAVVTTLADSNNPKAMPRASASKSPHSAVRVGVNDCKTSISAP